MYKPFSFLILILILLPISGISETNVKDSLSVKREILFRAFYQNGKVFQTNSFLKEGNQIRDDIDQFHAISLQTLWQTNGTHQWEHDFGFPRLGVGIWCARFYDAPDLGTPIAFYGLFNAPFIKHEKWSWNYELEMGLAINWGAFNPLTNKQNIAIGDDETAFLDLGTSFEYKISPKISVELGISLSHFSNGALKLPNYGINTIAPRIVFQYRPSETKYVKPKTQLITNKEKFEWQISIYGGANNVLYTGNDIDSLSKYKGVYFPQTGILTSVNRMLGKKSKIGLGFGLGYNGSANSKILVDGTELDEEKATPKEGFELSIFPSYEFVLARASIIIQPGFYLIRQKYEGRRPFVYQRVGIKYHFTQNIFAGLNLRAYDFYKSDYIEWNVGYRFKW
jgi:hypothetical protein